METTFAFDYTQRHAEELGISDDIKPLYNQAKASIGVNFGQAEEIAARITMVLLACATAEIDVEKKATDAKFIRRHSSMKIKQHILHRITSSCCLNGSAFRIPLPLASEALLTLIEDDDPQWEHMLMVVTGNFGINKKFGNHAIEILQEAEAEEIIVVPQQSIDLQPEEFVAWERIGEADYCYGYPIWAGIEEDDWIVRIRTFAGPISDIHVEDYDVFIDKDRIKILKRWVDDIETPGPIRSKLLTFVTDEGAIWNIYDTRFTKLLPEQVCELLALDPEDGIKEGDGFNLGTVHFLQEQLKQYNLSVRYWGGMAVHPLSNDPTTHGRLSWSINSDKGWIDLLGHREWQNEYINCGSTVPYVGKGYAGESDLLYKGDYEVLVGNMRGVKMIINKSNKVRLSMEKIRRWCKKVGRLPDEVVDPFMTTLAAKNKGDSVTPWKAAWTLVTQQRGLSPTDREKAAMTAGDFIMLSPLVGNKDFSMDGILLGI